jgi:TrmH family RNA methyltransferase
VQNLSGIKDPVFRDAMALAKPAGRFEQRRFLIEDSSMVHQALRDCPDRVRAVFCKTGESSPFESACAASRIPIYLATSGLLAKLIGTGYETATSAAAVVDMPNHSPAATPNPSGILLAGESIQDPRNVGVLVRTADALGCDALVLSRDSADPWQRAAVRSTTGSILRLPVILVDNFPGHLRHLAESGAQVVGSSGNVDRDVFQIDWSPRPLVVVVGNEQAGMTRDAMDACTSVARLPMASATRADSLNVTVAAGMLLLEALRAGR